MLCMLINGIGDTVHSITTSPQQVVHEPRSPSIPSLHRVRRLRVRTLTSTMIDDLQLSRVEAAGPIQTEAVSPQ
jgi:hypothetical protein